MPWLEYTKTSFISRNKIGISTRLGLPRHSETILADTRYIYRRTLQSTFLEERLRPSTPQGHILDAACVSGISKRGRKKFFTCTKATPLDVYCVKAGPGADTPRLKKRLRPCQFLTMGLPY